MNIKSVTLNPNAEASFECTGCINYELLNQLTNYNPMQPFNLTFEKPIMIQTRWHKKPRIRKKWLKRYGMKSDTVTVELQDVYGTIDTNTNEYEFNTNKLNYKFRPDQLRRGIKIKEN